MQELIQLIKQTGLSYSQLSLKLNKNKKYISWVLANGLSSKRQAELAEEIKTIINGGVVKTDAMVIAELSQKLTEAQDTNIANITIKKQLAEEIKILSDERMGLLSTEAELNAARETIQKLDSNLEYAVKTSQNDAQRILELESTVSTIDTENDELRATVGKQRIVGLIGLITIIILAATLIADSKFLFWV